MLWMNKKGNSKYVFVWPIYQVDTGNKYQSFDDGSLVLYVLRCQRLKNETEGMAS